MTTYYADWTIGSDAYDGLSQTDDGGGVGPWKSVDHAESQVSAGDTVYFKDNGTYTNDGHTRVLTMTASGTAGSPIKFIGYGSSPGDGEQCTWSGGSSDAKVISGSVSIHYRVFENLIVTQTGSNPGALCAGNSIMFRNCSGTSNASGGIWGTGYALAFDCDATNNTNNGFGTKVVIASLGSDNTGVQANAPAPAMAHRCVLHNSGDSDCFSTSATGHIVLSHVTTDGENASTAAAFYFVTSHFLSMTNCIAYDSANGFESLLAGWDMSRGAFHHRNVVNSNTDDYKLYGDDFDVSGNDLTGAPTFVDEASHDYTTASDSSAYGTAMDLAGNNSGRDIGAIQSPVRGVRRPTAMTGGMG